MKKTKIVKKLNEIDINTYFNNEEDVKIVKKINTSIENISKIIKENNIEDISEKKLEKNIKHLKTLKRRIKSSIKTIKNSENSENSENSSEIIKRDKKCIKVIDAAITLMKNELKSRKSQDMTLNIEEDYSEELDVDDNDGFDNESNIIED